ncbi:hypothetical protein [Demequina sp.]|uniref:hypothetical protein n=1 Tax=Demequina sp. TaxID=2050685 RepID=UPI0025C21025|nr:hypothetical protein [Demequina sp.]
MATKTQLRAFGIAGAAALGLAGCATSGSDDAQRTIATDGAYVEIDGPWEPDFATTVAASDVTVVMEPVSVGEPVLDYGTEPETGEIIEDEGAQGLPVTINTFRVTDVVDGEALEPGDEIVVVLTAWDYGALSEAGLSGLTDETVLLAALTHEDAGGTYLLDGDYYTPTGMFNGVIEISGDALVPWDSKLATIAGTPVDELSTSQAVDLLRSGAGSE